MTTTPTPPKGKGKGKSSLPPWLRDKRVQLGIAAAAGLGLVVLMRRGGSGSIPGTEDSAAGTPINPAQFDSSGTDAYNAIQSIGATWTNDLRTVAQLLGDIQSKLDSEPTGGTGTTPGRWTTPGFIDRYNNAKGLAGIRPVVAPPGRAPSGAPVSRRIPWGDRVVNWPPRRTPRR